MKTKTFFISLLVSASVLLGGVIVKADEVKTDKDEPPTRVATTDIVPHSLWAKSGKHSNKKEVAMFKNLSKPIKIELSDNIKELEKMLSNVEAKLSKSTLTEDEKFEYEYRKNAIEQKIDEVETNIAKKEEAKKKAEELQKQRIAEEKKRQEEEAKKKAAEERKRLEEQAKKLAEEKRKQEEELLKQLRGKNDVPICNPNATFYSWEPQLHNNPYRPNWAPGTNQAYYNSLAYTDDEGFSKIDDKYLVAMGNRYGPVGKEYEIEFSSGQVIKVMLGDTKGDRCAHSAGSNASMLEFIVDTHTSRAMPQHIRAHGNLPHFQGRIVRMTALN